jgi:hypothetical protein
MFFPFSSPIDLEELLCRRSQELRKRQVETFAVARDPGSMSRDRAGSEDAFVTNYASPIVLEVSILVLIESAAVWRFCWALVGGKRE